MARVSIGVPVFNGEKYLPAALESLLAQTYTDFELVVCDNDSTDDTEAICRRFAGRDPRVRYHRNPENIGASANFNRVLELTSGEYFKWAAADDLVAPEFLERCVEVLDGRPEVVLVYTGTKVIDEEAREVETHRFKGRNESRDPVQRFLGRLPGNRCLEVFGLIRRAALERTGPMGLYDHGDGILLARLLLLGPFAHVPHPLFFARRHAEQSMAMVGRHRDYAVWYNPKLRGKMVFPFWRRQLEFFRSVPRSPLTWSQRMRCYRHVLRSTWARRGILFDEIKTQLREAVTRPPATPELGNGSSTP